MWRLPPGDGRICVGYDRAYGRWKWKTHQGNHCQGTSTRSVHARAFRTVGARSSRPPVPAHGVGRTGGPRPYIKPCLKPNSVPFELKLLCFVIMIMVKQTAC